MRFILAIFLPPVAVFLCGKPFQALINIVLTFCFWVPGVIHALYVVMTTDAERRSKSAAREIAREMRKN